MVAYERHVTVRDGGEVVVSGVPLRAGQRVRVAVVVEETDRAAAQAEARDLLRRTQSLPQAKTITEQDILAEIAAHRSSAA
jgi:hypothetical protein